MHWKLTDTLATLQVTAMENVPASQRYMAARRAVLRDVVAAGIAILDKVDTHENLADMFTKPLPKDQFVYLRNLVLGVYSGSRSAI